MNHTIYVSKRSVLGQGISFQDLNSLLETIEDVSIVEWNAHQANWVKEIPSLVSNGVSTVIIPIDLGIDCTRKCSFRFFECFKLWQG